LDIYSQIKYLASFQRADAFEMDGFAVVVGAIVNFVETRGPLGHALLFIAFGFICLRHFILDENRFERAFRDAGTAIDASIWVNVVPGPLFDRFPRYDAFYRAYIYTPRISQAQTSDNVSH
jgi:hypothetical protein